MTRQNDRRPPQPPMIDSYFDIPLSSDQQLSPPPSVPYSPAYSDPGSSRAGSGTWTGSTPAYSDEEVDVDVDDGNRLRSRSYRRRKRMRAGAGKAEAGSIGVLGGKLGMTGILPLTTRSNGVNKWKDGGRAGRGAGGIDSIEILTEDDADDDDPDADDEGEPSGPTWGSHILIEQGALLLTTSAAWEEAFHPTFGLMRRGRGGLEGGDEDDEDTDEGVRGILTDERLEMIGDEVEWLVLDLRIVMGEEEYRTRAEVMGHEKEISDRPTVGSYTRRNYAQTTVPTVRTSSLDSASSNESSRRRNPNPAHLPKVHKLTFLGSEYAEIMSPSRAAMVREVVRELKGLLAVEWLPSHQHPTQSTSSSFSPAPFTPSFSTPSRSRAAIDSTTVTFPTCLVPQDLIDAGKRWNINWNRRPEGESDWRSGHLPEADESDKGIDKGDAIGFPSVGDEEAEREGESQGKGSNNELPQVTGPRSTGLRFYSDVSEKQREEEGTLSGVAISPLQWLGGLRSLKVQGGFPVPQPDESLGLVKPDYSFAFKPWIGECGVETLVWSFQGSYTETTTMTILKHLFKFVTTSWTKSCRPVAGCETRPACSLLVLQAVHPNVIDKLRNMSDSLTRRRVGLRVEDDVSADAFEWLRDVVFLEDKVPVEGEDREVPRLTRLWDTANEEENIRLDMDQVRALVRLKAEVLAHARAGRGAKPRPVRSKRVKPPKPLDWAALRERKGDLHLDLSERTARRGGGGNDDKTADMLSAPKTGSTIRPGPMTSGLTARLPNPHQLGSTAVSAGISRSSSYTTDPGTMADSLVSYGSSASLGTITDEDVAVSPTLAVGENAAALAGDEEEQEDGGSLTVKVEDSSLEKKAPLAA